jgi:hypothetical protein
MDKQEITSLLSANYASFINYINSLSEEAFLYRYQEKWSAGQQLSHIVLCVKPLVMVFSMDKAAIEQHFGKKEKTIIGYDALLKATLQKLEEGGKAPERFLPEIISFEQKGTLTATLLAMINELNAKIGSFGDEELNTLLIPHPLLGNLALREMLYNAIYHVKHHHSQTIFHLAQSKQFH